MQKHSNIGSGNPRSNGWLRLALALTTSLMLTACGSLIDFGAGNPPGIYRLAPEQTSAAGLEGGWSLLIDEPTVIAALRGDEIAVTRPGARIEYYADAIWVDRTARVVQRFLLEKFETVPGSFATSAGNLPTDWTLQLDIRDFTAHVGEDSSLAVVTLDVSVLLLDRSDTLSVAGQKRFVVSRNASASTLESVVPAFDRALDELAANILDWVDALAR